MCTDTRPRLAGGRGGAEARRREGAEARVKKIAKQTHTRAHTHARMQEGDLNLVLATICECANELDKLLLWFGNALVGKPQPCLVLRGSPRSGMPAILKLAQLLFGNEALLVHDEQDDELRQGKWPADDVLPNVLVATTMPLPEKMQERCTIVRCRRLVANNPNREELFHHFDKIMNDARADEQRLAELRAAMERLVLSNAE